MSDPNVEYWQEKYYAAIAEAEKDARRLTAENDALRVMVATIKCPYGYRLPSGVCQLGYPGCACMDDLMVAQERYPGDTEGAANNRLLKRAEAAEKQRDAAFAMLKTAHCPVPNCSEGMIINTGPDPQHDQCEWCYGRQMLFDALKP